MHRTVSECANSKWNKYLLRLVAKLKYFDAAQLGYALSIAIQQCKFYSVFSVTERERSVYIVMPSVKPYSRPRRPMQRNPIQFNCYVVLIWNSRERESNKMTRIRSR